MRKDDALLTVYGVMKGDIEQRRRLVLWLRKVAKEIDRAKPDEWAKIVRFRLMKAKAKS